MKMFDAVRLLLTTKLSDREIGMASGCSKTTVGRYRRVAAAKQITWERVAALAPDALQTLFNKPAAGGKRKTVPDLALLHEQLGEKGATLQLWWEDYRRADPDNTLSYSHLAAYLKDYREKLPTVMRQHHTPGEKLCVDFSGDRPHYIDPTTQQRVPVELFVAVLPASSLLFARCTPSQKVPDFIAAHVAMLEFFGGAPQILVPDNLKSAVTTAGKSPVIQRSYAEMARHYGIAVVPARPYRPKDKAAVEVGVKIAQQRILARLRHRHFYSIDELNAAVSELLEEINVRPMNKDGLSRRERFNAVERQALKPLPARPYVFAEWVAIPRVSKDYHVSVAGHFYSVPHKLIGEALNARLTDQTIEIMHRQRCVARHLRSHILGSHTTQRSHQPQAHQAYAERTPDGMREWAKSAGPDLLRFVQHQLDRPQPCLGLSACDILRQLADKHGTMILNEAARMALDLRTPTITALKRLLDNAANTNKPKVLRASYARGPTHYAQSIPC